MLRILLLDCSDTIRSRLESQGFKVESGTVGFCTGVRKLPSQVYEKDVIFYNPESLPSDGVFKKDTFKNLSPEYDLRYLESRIRSGATFVAFVNPLSNSIEVQRAFYEWIPFVPEIEFTSDKIVAGNAFTAYPDTEAGVLAPIVTAANLSLPVRVKLKPPKRQDYLCDVFSLFWNGHGDCLGVQILRGRGALIFLPKYNSNDEMIETFLYRVVPRIYGSNAKRTLSDIFASPAEQAVHARLEKLQSIEQRIKQDQETARTQLAAATREKRTSSRPMPLRNRY